jgi:hypothetical protein
VLRRALETTSQQSHATVNTPVAGTWQDEIDSVLREGFAEMVGSQSLAASRFVSLQLAPPLRIQVARFVSVLLVHRKIGTVMLCLSRRQWV